MQFKDLWGKRIFQESFKRTLQRSWFSPLARWVLNQILGSRPALNEFKEPYKWPYRKIQRAFCSPLIFIYHSQLTFPRHSLYGRKEIFLNQVVSNNSLWEIFDQFILFCFAVFLYKLISFQILWIKVVNLENLIIVPELKSCTIDFSVVLASLWKLTSTQNWMHFRKWNTINFEKWQIESDWLSTIVECNNRIEPVSWRRRRRVGGTEKNKHGDLKSTN